AWPDGVRSRSKGLLVGTLVEGAVAVACIVVGVCQPCKRDTSGKKSRATTDNETAVFGSLPAEAYPWGQLHTVHEIIFDTAYRRIGIGRPEVGVGPHVSDLIAQ